MRIEQARQWLANIGKVLGGRQAWSAESEFAYYSVNERVVQEHRQRQRGYAAEFWFSGMHMMRGLGILDANTVEDATVLDIGAGECVLAGELPARAVPASQYDLAVQAAPPDSAREPAQSKRLWRTPWLEPQIVFSDPLTPEHCPGPPGHASSGTTATRARRRERPGLEPAAQLVASKSRNCGYKTTTGAGYPAPVSPLSRASLHVEDQRRAPSAGGGGTLGSRPPVVLMTGDQSGRACRRRR